MPNIFDKQSLNLKKLNKQRVIWLILSKFFFVLLILAALFWDEILAHYSANLLIVVECVVIFVTVGWWYWTMHLVNNLISNRKAEIEILKVITEDIRSLKESIKQLD